MKEKIFEKMIAFYQGNIEDINHFIKVHAFAALIGRMEGLDEDTQAVLEYAAIVHDIACPLCREKYGNTDGRHQEEESEALLRTFLAEFPIAAEGKERIIYLVTHHHTYRNVEGMDYQILLEADFLVNAGESEKYARVINEFRQNVFKTSTGLRLLEEMYPQDKMVNRKDGISASFVSIGIDGCRGGWLAAVIQDGKLELRKFCALNEIFEALVFDACLIDMVIGLQGNEDQIRPDGAARRILKGRASTVFPAPCRKAVYGETKGLRLKANEEVLHKKFPSQTDAIIPKMREVDEFLQQNPKYKNTLQESHPEVCFARLKGEVLATSKHEAKGIQERAAILAGYLPDVTEAWILDMAKRMKCNADDITDSICLAVTANLSAQGKTETIPENPMKDDTGLLMQMVIPR